MKKYIYGILGLLLVLLLVSIIPNFIDWSHYKGPIAEAVKTHTGFTIDLRGPVRFQFLPTPHLTAKDVYVKNKPQGQAENIITLKSLSLSVDLIPLFSKKIIVTQVELDTPEIYLETFKNGKNNWDLEVATSNSAPATPTTTEIKTGSVNLSAQEPQESKNFNLSLQKLIIKDGTINYQNQQTKAHHEIRDIDLEGSMDSLMGPFFIKGHLEVDGYSIKGDIQTGEITSEKPSLVDMTMSVSKAGQDHGTLQIKGTVQSKKFIGNVKSEALKIPFVLDLKNKKFDLQKGILLSAQVEAEPENIKITNLSAQIETVKLNGNIAYKAPQIDLKLTINEGSSAIDLSAKGQTKDKALWDGSIAIRSDNPQPFLKWVDADKFPYLQGSINVSTHLSVSSSSYVLKSLNFTVGKIKGTGQVLFQKEKEKPYLNADLSLNALDLNVLLASEGKKTPISVPAASSKEKVILPSKTPIAPVNSGGSTSMRWSKEVWDLDILKALNADLKFSIGEVLYDVYQLHQIKGAVHLKEGNLLLSSFQAAGYGGNFNGTMSVNQGAPASIKIDGSIQGVNIATLPQARHSPLKKAVLEVSMHLTSRGNNTWQAINTLSGNIHLNLTNGIVEAFNVKKFVSDIKRVKAPTDVYTLLQSLNTKSDISFTHLKGDFKAQEGKATTHNMEFLSEEVMINADGTINLPQWSLNMNAKIKVRELGKLPPIGMKIEGSLESPAYKMDEQALVNILLSEATNHLLNKAVKNIGGDVGKVINSVLGNEEAQKSGTKQQQNDSSIKPEKLLKNLLGL